MLPTPTPFQRKLEEVRNSLASEGFDGIQVTLDEPSDLVNFYAPGASSSVMRPEEFDALPVQSIVRMMKSKLRDTTGSGFIE